MVTQYHMKVVSKLDELKEMLEVIRLTPVEIVATQEMRPAYPFESSPVPGRCPTPTVSTAGPLPTLMPPPFAHTSPTREVHQLQQIQPQQSPSIFQRNYTNAMVQANHDAWNAAQQLPRTLSLDCVGDAEGMPHKFSLFWCTRAFYQNKNVF